MPSQFWRFFLIVTGKTEEAHLSKLFQRSLMSQFPCHFRVERRIPQRSPITSPTRQLKMIGTGRVIPDEDANQIGLPARRILADDPNSFVLLIDDMEHDRTDAIDAVYSRYRKAADTMLLEDQQRRRFTVHFLVKMLEAYYLADAKAINDALGTSLVDFKGDVETIRNAKGELKDAYRQFDEIEDGGRILARLDVGHVLSRKETCAALRTLFGWCVNRMGKPFTNDYRLDDGILWPVTCGQIHS